LCVVEVNVVNVDYHVNPVDGTGNVLEVLVLVSERKSETVDSAADIVGFIFCPDVERSHVKHVIVRTEGVV